MIVYIDGFNLYYGLKSNKWKRFYWLDLESLSKKLLRSDQKLELARYFTARIKPRAGDPGSSQRQATYLEALDTLPNLRIHFGHFLSKPRMCQSCGATWETFEEKMSDVNLAVELLGDAHDNQFDTAIVVSGDSDLVSPIRAVKQRYPNKRVVFAFPPNRTSAHLRKVADGHLQIRRSVLNRCQLPNNVKKPDGFNLVRPREWI